MSELTRAFEEVVVTEGGRTQESAQLPVEAPLTIEVNGAPLATFMRLPGNDRELALGFLVTQGIVDDPSAVSSLEHSPDDPNLLRVHLTGEEPELPRADVGAVSAGILPEELPEPVPLEGPPVAAEVLMSLRELLEGNQPVRERAGGVHAAALFTREGELLAAYEDLGRHNALDKVIGHCLARGDPLADKIVLTTGRLRADMVVKAARARVALVCSITAPSSLGVELADRLGVTVVARLRRNQLQVFSHPERVA